MLIRLKVAKHQIAIARNLRSSVQFHSFFASYSKIIFQLNFFRLLFFDRLLSSKKVSFPLLITNFHLNCFYIRHLVFFFIFCHFTYQILYKRTYKYTRQFQFKLNESQNKISIVFFITSSISKVRAFIRQANGWAKGTLQEIANTNLYKIDCPTCAEVLVATQSIRVKTERTQTEKG